jgi:hypothetical protein
MIILNFWGVFSLANTNFPNLIYYNKKIPQYLKKILYNIFMKRQTQIKVQTCESVGRGHPDKFCDGVADAVLTAYLKKDKNAHVACEVCAFNKTIVVGGEFKSSAKIDKLAIAKAYLKKI